MEIKTELVISKYEMDCLPVRAKSIQQLCKLQVPHMAYADIALELLQILTQIELIVTEIIEYTSNIISDEIK